LFGDGISGAIPTIGSTIRAEYSIGGGSIGNISAGVLSEIYYVPDTDSTEFNNILADVTTTNSSVGVGGVDPEDSFSIRKNAPLALKAIRRAVTLEDYATLALSQPNVGKSNAHAEVWSSVTVYIAPVRNVNDTELYPGYTIDGGELTAEWDFLETYLAAYFQDKIQIGTSVQIAPPEYTDVYVSLSVIPADGYTYSQTETEVREQFLLQYSYSGTEFGQVIIPEVIERDLNLLPSVKVAKVTVLTTASGSSERTSLVGAPGEIFVFANPNLTVTQPSSDASLTGLTVNSGTLSPAFDADFYVYNVTSYTAESITITPTPATGATATVNGASAATAVLTPIGTTSIPIIVTASDGITIKVYTVVVSRSS
jgi:hypothetical protein